MVREFTLVALVLLFAPSDTLDLFGVSEEWEVRLVRWAGLFLLCQAALLSRMARKNIHDDGWGRLVLAGHAVAVLGVLYVIVGEPLLLFLATIGLIGITLRTLMSVLDAWSIEVWTRFEEGR